MASVEDLPCLKLGLIKAHGAHRAHLEASICLLQCREVVIPALVVQLEDQRVDNQLGEIFSGDSVFFLTKSAIVKRITSNLLFYSSNFLSFF